MELPLKLLIFFIGASIGSFAYAFAFRFPAGRPWVFSRSRCDKCGKNLSWRELVPVLSFVIQAGRCRGCKKFVGWGYLLSELILGFGFLMLWNNLFNFSGDFISSLFLTAFIAIFFIIAIADLKYFIIPDKLLILGLILSVVFLIFKNGLSVELLNNFFTALVFSSVFFAIWFLSKKKWLGFGDVKLIGVIGLLFGFPGALWVLYLAVAAGLVISLYLVLFKKADRKTPVPFGAFLSGAAIALILFEPQIGSFFLNLLI